MRTPPILALFLALLVAACGPNEAQLRSELQSIDGELTAISIAMNQWRSQISQAEFDAAVGSFAAGYGLTSGDYGLAGDGARVTSEAFRQYDVSSYSLQQLGYRAQQLLERRRTIVNQLR